MMRITVKGVPPSLNQFAGRENSWDYRKAKAYWTQLVWAECMASKERPREPFALADVEVLYYFPTRSRHDADNYAGKFLLDGLTKARVITDDDMAHIRLHVAGDYDRKQPRTVITVREVDADV